jgi:CBS domain-containing protein
MRINDVMTRDVVSVHPETALKEVARLLVEHRIGGMPVVDADNKVVGVISETDLTIKERGADYKRDSILDRLAGRTAADEKRVVATTAGEAMTSPAVTIEDRIGLATVREAAIVMLERKVNRLPVTEDGKLVGIITRGDVVRVYAQPDEDIAERLRNSLRDVDGLTVEGVADGIVTLSGTVASEELRETAIHLAASADGVVAVRSDGLFAVKPERAHEPIGGEIR